MFIVVTLLLLLSTIPLFFSKEIHKPIHFKLKDIFKGNHKRNIITFMADGIEGNIGAFVWPIFIYLTIINNIAILGSVKSLSVLASVIMLFVIGKLTDINRRFALWVGSSLTALIWMLRFMVRTTSQVFMVYAGYGMSRIAINIPFDAICYDKANRSDVVRFIIVRECMINLGKGMIFLILAWTSNIYLGFIMASTASILIMLF